MVTRKDVASSVLFEALIDWNKWLKMFKSLSLKKKKKKKKGAIHLRLLEAHCQILHRYLLNRFSFPEER